jgi:hypothetical protein
VRFLSTRFVLITFIAFAANAQAAVIYDQSINNINLKITDYADKPDAIIWKQGKMVFTAQTYIQRATRPLTLEITNKSTNTIRIPTHQHTNLHQVHGFSTIMGIAIPLLAISTIGALFPTRARSYCIGAMAASFLISGLVSNNTFPYIQDPHNTK